MEQPFKFESESCEINPEMWNETWELNPEFIEQEWQGETNHNSPAFMKWVQSSLNRIMGLRLAVDGVMGPMTRSAIRSFQQKRGLVTDGIVGPKTEAAIRFASKNGPQIIGTIPTGTLSPLGQGTVNIPPDTIKPADSRIKRFDFDKADLTQEHLKEIDKVAARIVESWRSGKPIVTVRVVGHADPVGTPQYNQVLGLRRALAVRKQLTNTLEQKQKGLSYKVLILASSKGESEPIDNSGSPDGQAENRRVEIFLSTKALLPFPKKKQPDPVKPPDPINIPPIIIAGGCDKEQLSKMLSDCQVNYRNCIAKCETDKAFIWNKIKDNVAIASCFSLKHPAAIAACALALGGVYYKELIDEYFRLSGCQQSCEILLKYCKELAQERSRCL